ncbi:MAG: electron transfer flavoprotein subunit beta/FixA family protein [Gemmatimonadota bacterium]|nr:electron transfer flavoprotein subunit beta/FixA family protein [Gemmatimonadota bacterium]
MRVIVCLKRVPDTGTSIRIDISGSAIDFEGVKYIISPYDEYAIELGLRQRDASDDGELALVTLDDMSAQETLRKGLAMGADSAVLLTGDFDMDGLRTAKALAKEVESAEAELILFGIKAVDDDQQQVGPMVAALIGRPCVTGFLSFEILDGRAICCREVDSTTEVVEVDLPAVLTIAKGPHEPRLATLKNIMASKRKPLEVKAAALTESRVCVRGLFKPVSRPPGRIVGEGPDAVPELLRVLREEAKVI